MPIIPRIAGSGGSIGTFTTGSTPVISPQSTEISPNSLSDIGSASLAANTIPINGAPNDVLAALTLGGRNLMGRALIEGTGYRIIGFRVGMGGYDPLIPLNALPLNEANTELLAPFYPPISLPPAPIDRFEHPNDNGVSFLCRVPSNQAVAGIGEIGLYAEITFSSNPSEIGDIILFAHAQRPLVGKTLQDVLVWRIVIQS